MKKRLAKKARGRRRLATKQKKKPKDESISERYRQLVERHFDL